MAVARPKLTSGFGEIELPDSITIEEFIRNEQYGRYPLAKARNPYTCGITGTTYSAAQVAERTDYMARAISKRLGFNPQEESEWERVGAIYSVNTVRTPEPA